MEDSVMKVSHKQLIAASMVGFAAGLLVAPRFDTLIKVMDPKLASSLRGNIRWLVPSSIALAGVAYLLKSTQQTSEVDKADKEEPVVKKDFEPVVRNVPDTSRVLTADEKKLVTNVLQKAEVQTPGKDQNKEFLFWYEMIQWLETIGGQDVKDVSRQANENPMEGEWDWRIPYIKSQRFEWANTPFLQVYSSGKSTASFDNKKKQDWHRGRFAIGTLGNADWEAHLAKGGSVALKIKNEPLELDPNNLGTVIKSVLKGKWPDFGWNARNTNDHSHPTTTGKDLSPHRMATAFGLTFYDNKKTWPDEELNSNN